MCEVNREAVGVVQEKGHGAWQRAVTGRPGEPAEDLALVVGVDVCLLEEVHRLPVPLQLPEETIRRLAVLVPNARHVGRDSLEKLDAGPQGL